MAKNTGSALTSAPALALQRALLAPVMRLPAPVLRRLAGGEPEPVDGQTLDPQVQLLLRLVEKNGLAPPEELGAQAARQQADRSYGAMAVRTAPLALVQDRSIPGDLVGLRVYTPRDVPTPSPALLYFHGGGMVLGSVDTHDAVCRLLANTARLRIVSVDYRLAPEHPFPAGVDDAMTAYRWLLDHAHEVGVDPKRIAVGGDSAGGYLGARLCHDARDDGLPLPAFQLLVYPVTDWRRALPSHQTFAEGYFLTEASMSWFTEQYLQRPEQALHPRASPLLAERFEGLPPALVVTAGFDPLRDEGREYAARLEAAGVPTRYVCQTGLIHGFASMTGILSAARVAMAEVAGSLAMALS